MDIKELQPRSSNADVEGVIIDIAPARLFNKFGKEGRVANAKLQDSSGTITLTLWNEQIDQVKVGDRVKITKGWVSEWQGDLQLSTGKFGAMTVVSGGSSPSPSGGSEQPRAAAPAAGKTSSPSKQSSSPAPLADENIADESETEEEFFDDADE